MKYSNSDNIRKSDSGKNQLPVTSSTGFAASKMAGAAKTGSSICNDNNFN
jgi:hypothetical protein